MKNNFISKYTHYNKGTRFLFLLSLLVLFSSTELLAQTFYSRATGDWNNTNTWSTVGCGGAAAATLPTATSDIVICSGNTVTANVAVTCRNMTVNNTGRLQITNQSFTVTQATTVDTGGTINDNNLGGDNTYNTIINNGIFTVTVAPSDTYNTFFNGNITNNGTFSLSGSNQYTFTSNLTITNNGGNMRFTFDFATGLCFINTGTTVTIANGTSTGFVALYGNIINLNGAIINNYSNGELRLGKFNGTGTVTNSGYIYYEATNTAPTANLINNAGSTFNYAYDSEVKSVTYHNILFSNFDPFACTLIGNITVNGNLSLTSGNTILNANANGINLKGNWSNVGTFNGGTGTVSFTGTTNQTITGSTTFNNLTINNANDVTINSGNNAVSNTLTLTNGKVILNNAANLSFNTITGASNTKYIVTNGTGSLRKINSATNVTFPIGSTTNYQPLRLSNAAANSSMRFGAGLAVPASGVGSWFVNNATTNSTVALLNPQGGTLSATSRVHVNSAGWNPLPTTATGSNYTTSGSFTFANTTHEFSVFTTPIPTVNLSVSSATGSEAAASVITVTATASQAVVGNQTVNLAITGTGITTGDYNLSSTTITILDGQTTGTATFTVVDDALVEGTETATLTISSPSAGITLGTTTSRNITITDNDSPTVNLSVSSTTGAEAVASVITVTATASQAVVGNQTVNLAITGTGITTGDYNLSSTTITLLDGQTTGTATFNVVDDALVEGTETATLTISSPSAGITLGTTTSRNITITDNDFAPIITLGTITSTTYCAGETISIPFTPSGAFNGGNTFTAQLSDATGSFAAPTATQTGTNPISLVIPAGATTATAYRVRVVSSNPVVNSASSADIIINALPLSRTIVANPSSIVSGNTTNIEVPNSETGVSYQLQDVTNGNANVGSPVIGTGTAISLPTQILTANNDFRVVATRTGCSTTLNTVTVTVNTLTITLGTITSTTYCAGETISIPFTPSGTFNGGNTFTAQLSDATGSFAAPTATQTGTNPISLVIPAGATTATAYRVRVVSSNPVVNSASSADITINALPLTRMIVANPSSIVSGNTTNIEVPNSETGVSYQLQDVTNSNANVGSPVIGTGTAISLPTQILTANNDFRVVATRTGCSTTLNTVTVTVNTLTITLGTITSTTYCAGETISIPFTPNGTFNGGNTFTAQLSDATGSFAAPTATQTGTSPITLTIPAGLATATAYRIRVVSSNPVVNSASSADITINALPLSRTIVANPSSIVSGNTTNIEVPNSETGVSYQLQDVTNGNANVGSPVIGTGTTISLPTQILTANNDFRVVATRTGCSINLNTVTVTVNTLTITLGTITSTTYCAGETISIPFTPSGAFNGGNTFTAQLSDETGSFAAPTATQTGTNPISLVIPAGATTATAYRVRVVSSNPVVNSASSADITINTIPLSRTIVANPSSIVSGNTTNIEVPNSETGVNYQLQITPANTDVGTAVGGTGGTIMLSTGNLAATSSFRVVATRNGCSRTLNTVTVTTSSGDVLLVETGINYPTIQAAVDAAVAGNTIKPTFAKNYNENVTVNKNLTFTSDFTNYRDVNINQVRVTNGNKLTITGNMSIVKILHLEATGQVEVTGSTTDFALLSTVTTGTALVINDSPTNTVVGNVIMERYLSTIDDLGGTNGQGYHLFSSPFSDATVSQFGDDMGLVLTAAYNTAPEPAFTRPFPTFFQYEETNAGATTSAYFNPFISNYKVPTTPNLTVTRGYQANIATGVTVDLNGTLNNGNQSIAITNSGGGFSQEGYNLIGNPYPSPIDWDKVLLASTGVANAVYIDVPVNQYEGIFAEYVNGTPNNGGSNRIASMQGFFVKTTTGGTVNMNNGVRLNADTRFFKTTETKNAKEGLVRVALKKGNSLDETTIYFEAGATPNFDDKYDAAKLHKMNITRSTLYSYNENAETAETEYFAINGLGSFKEEQKLHLAMNILTEGSYEITLRDIKYFHSKHNVYLYDSLTDSLHNLRAEGDYKFVSAKGNEIKRFVLVFKTDASQDFFVEEKVVVYPNPTPNSFSYSLKTAREGSYTIRLFDATGRMVLEESKTKEGAFLEGTINLEKHASGLYLLQLSDSQKTTTVRVVKE